MYSIINRNIDVILRSINRESHINQYLFLINKPRETEGKIFKDLEYRKLFRAYWGMNSARLSIDFFEMYFDILDELYFKNINPTEIASRMYKARLNGNGKNSFQFSFASKMAHMSNTKLPIYDSMVANFYHMPPITQNDLRGKEFQSECNYKFLMHEYERILSLGILDDSINRFREEFGLDVSFSDHKIIDSIIWAFISHAKKGGVINKTIVYT